MLLKFSYKFFLIWTTNGTLRSEMRKKNKLGTKEKDLNKISIYHNSVGPYFTDNKPSKWQVWLVSDSTVETEIWS